MELKLKRIAKKETYTIGRLYIDGVRYCDTLEDTDRGLKQSDGAEICKEKKVKGKTAIPTGTYTVVITYSPRFKRNMPKVLNVHAFQGILIHCLTPDMEILTENGWQNLQSYKENTPEKCYSYNVQTGKIELVDIDAFIERDYNGKLYCNEGRRVPYSVTDEHRMFVGTRLHDQSVEWGFRKANNIPTSSMFRTAAQKDGVELTPKQKLFWRLLMAVQADGYILNWSSKSSQVRFHFTKERKIKRVEDIVTNMGYTYKKFRDHVGKIHITLCKELSEMVTEAMNPNRYVHNYKELPNEILELKSEDLHDLIMEYLFFDGRWANYLKCKKNMTISSTNMNTLNLLQTMATFCGMRSFIHNSHAKNLFEIVLYENQDRVTPMPCTYAIKDYNGKVWCLSNKNTTLIVRKGFHPLIIGNCGNTSEDTEGCILVGKNTKVGMVTQSRNTFRTIYSLLYGAYETGEQITLKIE